MGRHSNGPNRDHYAGNCWCGINHSVPSAMAANFKDRETDKEQNTDQADQSTEQPQYGEMIKRSDTGPDPLVQEP